MDKAIWIACAALAAVETYVLVLWAAVKAILDADLLLVFHPLPQFALGLAAFGLCMAMAHRIGSERPLRLTPRAMGMGWAGVFLLTMISLFVGALAFCQVALERQIWQLALPAFLVSYVFLAAAKSTLVAFYRAFRGQPW